MEIQETHWHRPSIVLGTGPLTISIVLRQSDDLDARAGFLKEEGMSSPFFPNGLSVRALLDRFASFR